MARADAILLLLRASLLARQGLEEAAQLAYRHGLQEAEYCGDAYTISGYLGLLELAESLLRLLAQEHGLKLVIQLLTI